MSMPSCCRSAYRFSASPACRPCSWPPCKPSAAPPRWTSISSTPASIIGATSSPPRTRRNGLSAASSNMRPPPAIRSARSATTIIWKSATRCSLPSASKGGSSRRCSRNWMASSPRRRSRRRMPARHWLPSSATSSVFHSAASSARAWRRKPFPSRTKIPCNCTSATAGCGKWKCCGTNYCICWPSARASR